MFAFSGLKVRIQHLSGHFHDAQQVVRVASVEPIPRHRARRVGHRGHFNPAQELLSVPSFVEQVLQCSQYVVLSVLASTLPHCGVQDQLISDFLKFSAVLPVLGLSV